MAGIAFAWRRRWHRRAGAGCAAPSWRSAARDGRKCRSSATDTGRAIGAVLGPRPASSASYACGVASAGSRAPAPAMRGSEAPSRWKGRRAHVSLWGLCAVVSVIFASEVFTRRSRWPPGALPWGRLPAQLFDARRLHPTWRLDLDQREVKVHSTDLCLGPRFVSAGPGGSLPGTWEAPGGSASVAAAFGCAFDCAVLH